MPIDATGSIVDFGIDVSSRPLTVRLIGPDGKVAAAGLEGLINGSHFVVGYGGLAFFSRVLTCNVVTLKLATTDCRAEFNTSRPTR